MKYKIATIALAVMMVACSSKDTDPGAIEASVTKASASHPQPKPGAQVALVDHHLYTIEPGEQAALDIRLHSLQAQGSMRIAITGSEGLNIVSGSTEQVFTLAPGASYELPLQVYVEQPGRYYVHLHIVTEGSGRQLSRVVSVIVQSGKEQQLKLLRKSQAGAELPGEVEALDETLIMLPAHETVVQ